MIDSLLDAVIPPGVQPLNDLGQPLLQPSAPATAARQDTDTPAATAPDTVTISDEAAALAEAAGLTAANPADTAETPGEPTPSGYTMLESWGSMTRADGATVTVGHGRALFQDTGGYRDCTLVTVTGTDGATTNLELALDKVYRLRANDQGGYEASENLQGDAGDDIYLGQHLNDVNIDAGDGDNTLFAATSDNLTYQGGAGRDAVFIAKVDDSAFALGGGDDLVKSRYVRSSGFDLGAGDDTVDALEMAGGAVMGGSGKDTLRGALDGTTVAMGDGADLVSGQTLDNSRIDMGAGDDRLHFEYIRGATVDTGPGRDRLDGYAILDSTVTTGDGADRFDLYAIADSNVDTGNGDDAFHLYEVVSSTVSTGAGNDGFDLHAFVDSQVDTGAGQDTVDIFRIDHSTVGMGGGRDTLKVDFAINDSTIRTDGRSDAAMADDPDGDPNAPGDSGGDGMDTITAESINNSRIRMGGGRDTLTTGQLRGSDLETGISVREGGSTSGDRDTVRVVRAENSRIATGSGDDTVEIGSGKNLHLDGGDGYDHLILRGPLADGGFGWSMDHVTIQPLTLEDLLPEPKAEETTRRPQALTPRYASDFVWRPDGDGWDSWV